MLSFQISYLLVPKIEICPQSCIKEFLVVKHFCFCAVCAAGPVHFFMFSGSKLDIKIFLKHNSLRTKKLHNKLKKIYELILE